MTSIEQLRRYAERAVHQAREKVDSVIARILVSETSQIRFSQNEIDINKKWSELKLELFIVIEGTKTGFSESSISHEKDIDNIIESTIKFTKHLPESVFFAGIEDSINDYPTMSDKPDEHIDDFTQKAPAIVYSAIDSAIAEGAKRVAGALKFDKTSSYFMSSFGMSGERITTEYDINIRAFQEELDYSGQGLSCGTVPSRSENEILKAGAEAGRLSKLAIGARQGNPGIYDLIMSPTVAADVIGYVPKSANPFTLLIGMSPLQDKFGEQIAPEDVTVYDDPLYPGGLGSQVFDFEGTPAKTTTIIDRGIMKNLIHNTSTAKMYETESTGSSQPRGMMRGTKMLLPVSSNVVFENGAVSFDEMIDTSRPTIYVTSNWYTRWQNYQTGEFSTIPRDAMFLVRNGELTPIKNLRLSDNILRTFRNIAEIGNDRRQIKWWEVPTPTVIPTMKITDCRMTAATQ
jgi:PmbA protein